MDFTKLGTLNQTNVDKAEQANSKAQNDIATIKTQEVFVKSIQLLTKFMEGHTTRTVVVNQIRDFATSGDIDKATKVLDELHATLKTHENTDVSPVVDVLEKVVSQLEQIPKEHPELPEAEEQKDYSEQFNKFIAVAESIVEAVKAQETNVEAPTVNVDAPVVNVEAPDLKPLAEELDKALRVSFKKAIDGIKPAKPTDLKPVVKAQEKTTKSIDRLYKLMEENPFGGGGAGGAGIGSFMSDGALPTVSGLVPKVYDTVQITSYNANDDPLVVLYKTGGTSGATVATLTLTYSGTNITSVVRT